MHHLARYPGHTQTKKYSQKRAYRIIQTVPIKKCMTQEDEDAENEMLLIMYGSKKHVNKTT